MNPRADNPAAAFYDTPVARALAWLIRAAHGVSIQGGTALAMRLFFTPLAPQRARRARSAPAAWSSRRHRFEGGWLTTWHHVGPDDPTAQPVLLAHGWAGDAQQMRPLGEALAQAGYDPVLLDLPAHGASSGRRATLPQWVRAMFAVSANLGPWHAVAGHSLGSLAAANALARGLAAERLVLIASSPPPALFLRWFAAGLGMTDSLAQRMEGSIQRLEGVGVDQFEPAWLGARLRQPVLLVHDADDRTAPLTNARQLAEALPSSQTLVTQGLGHRRILDDSRVLARVLEHLSGHSG